MALYSQMNPVTKDVANVTCLPDPKSVQELNEDYTLKWDSSAWYDGHVGIDIGGYLGKQLYNCIGGVVTETAYTNLRGNYVVIKSHTTRGVVYMRFCHLDWIGCSVGQWLNNGDLVGEMGATGKVEGVHLHFAVTKNGVAVDPIPYMFRVVTEDSYVSGSNANPSGLETIEQNGYFKCEVDNLRVRKYPSLNGDIEGVCVKDKTYVYSKLVVNDGYRWIYLPDYDTWCAWSNEDKSDMNGVVW